MTQEGKAAQMNSDRRVSAPKKTQNREESQERGKHLKTVEQLFHFLYAHRDAVDDDEVEGELWRAK